MSPKTGTQDRAAIRAALDVLLEPGAVRGGLYTDRSRPARRFGDGGGAVLSDRDRHHQAEQFRGLWHRLPPGTPLGLAFDEWQASKDFHPADRDAIATLVREMVLDPPDPVAAARR